MRMADTRMLELAGRAIDVTTRGMDVMKLPGAREGAIIGFLSYYEGSVEELEELVIALEEEYN
jgi:hypothetical protein